MNKDNFNNTTLPQNVLSEIGRINGILFNNFVKHQDEIKQLSEELETVKQQKNEIETKFIKLTNSTDGTTSTPPLSNGQQEEISDKKDNVIVGSSLKVDEQQIEIEKLLKSIQVLEDSKCSVVTQYENERNSWELQVNAMKIEISNLINQLQEQQQQLKLIQVYEFKENKLTEERDDLLKKVAELQKHTQELQEKLDQQVNTMSEYKLQQEHKEQNYVDPTQLISDNKQLDEKCDFLEKSKVELQQQLEQLQEQLGQFKRDSSSNIDNLNEQIHLLSVKNQETVEANAKLQLENDSLEKDIQTLKEKDLNSAQLMNGYKENEETNQNHIQELKAKIEQLESSNNQSANEQVEKLLAEINSLKQENQEKDKILLEQNQQLIQKIQEFEKVQEQSQKYTALLEEFEKQRAILDEQVKLKTDLLDDIKKERSSNQLLITQLEEKDQQLKDKDTAIQSLKDVQVKDSEKINSLQATIQHYQDTYHEHEVEVQTNITDSIDQHHSDVNQQEQNDNNNSDGEEEEEPRLRQVEDIVNELYRTGTPPLTPTSVPQRLHQDLVDLDLNAVTTTDQDQSSVVQVQLSDQVEEIQDDETQNETEDSY
ncbi:hypothetical protein DLAC_10423 [Tieghemostelium lacteum]|uniref:Uncharacterized protein n=1 Tax=Tieghemostelium lacteum TaxID=361077 RepID=A0A151Z5D2_TIELA|nr:hypothetical protein DLAC_10423 [Tieghemostelium lacteum]|eukprot:KYQ89179.1 hypothetical protein DLAC_10423 [Tieghemostelium lacteum]